MSAHQNANRMPTDGSPVPAKARYTLKAKANGKGQATEKLNAYGVQAICHDVLNGWTLTQIAREVGVSIAALVEWRDADTERSAQVRKARTVRAELWDELAIAEIRAATDKLSMDKAREIAHHYRWRAAKTNPKEYGDRIDATITFNSGLADRLSAAMSRSVGRVIDVEADSLLTDETSEAVPHAD